MNVVLSPTESETARPATTTPATSDWRFKPLGLSRQESRVIELAMEGRIDKQIAQEIGISLGTVRVYWKRLRFKTGGTRSEAIAKLAKQSLQLDYDEVQQRANLLQSQIDLQQDAYGRLSALESAFMHVGFPVVVVEGPNAEVVLANPAFAALTGQSADALHGTNPFADPDAAKTALGKTKLKPQKAKLALRKKTGETASLEFNHCGEPEVSTVLWQNP